MTVQETHGILGARTRWSRGFWVLGWRSPLARRAVVLAVLCSTVIALVTTCAQLYADYKRDITMVEDSVLGVKQAVVPALAESVWIVDETLIHSHLAGMIRIDGIKFVEVEEPDGTRYSTGEKPKAYEGKLELPLWHVSGGEETLVGTLRVHVSYEEAVNRLFERGVILLISNAVESFLVAACLLVIFHTLVGRHLSHIAAFARTYQPGASQPLLALDRPLRSGQTDELSDVEEALNQTILTNRKYTTELEAANAVIADNLQTLEQANLSLADANREQAEFTYAISHDLKSPSNTIGMLIDCLASESDLGENERVILSDMRATNQRMRQLVDDVLAYSRIVEGEVELEEIDPHVVVDAVVQDLNADVLAAGAQITIGPLPRIRGHAMQLRLLFQNLIANALKFRAPGRAPRIEITAKECAAEVQISVADNGIGIPEAYRERVFGLFQRLHTQSAYEGTGLGLTICRRVMANLGGSIDVGSGLDGGTAITMTFRRDGDDQADQARSAD